VHEEWQILRIYASLLRRRKQSQLKGCFSPALGERSNLEDLGHESWDDGDLVLHFRDRQAKVPGGTEGGTEPGTAEQRSVSTTNGYTEWKATPLDVMLPAKVGQVRTGLVGKHRDYGFKIQPKPKNRRC